MAEKDAKPKKQSTIKQIIQIYKYTAKELSLIHISEPTRH